MFLKFLELSQFASYEPSHESGPAIHELLP